MGSFLYKLTYVDAILFRLRVSSALGDEFHIDLYFIAVQCIVLIFLKFLHRILRYFYRGRIHV